MNSAVPCFSQKTSLFFRTNFPPVLYHFEGRVCIFNPESLAEVRRAQEAVLKSRPFSESIEKILGGLLKRVKLEGLDLPLLEERAVKKVSLASRILGFSNYFSASGLRQRFFLVFC